MPNLLNFKEDRESYRLKRDYISGWDSSSHLDSSKSHDTLSHNLSTNCAVYSTMPPFDRHDWIVTRPPLSETPDTITPKSESDSSAGTLTTRYVIDYYSAPPDEEGNPVFHLDVRPALDNLESINLRIKVGFEQWMKRERT